MRRRSYVEVGSTDFPSSFALFAPLAVNHAGLRSGRKICFSRLAVALWVSRKCPRLRSILVAAMPRWVIRKIRSFISSTDKWPHYSNSRGDSDNVGPGAIKNRDGVTAPKNQPKSREID
jgi:hypothetical protein